MARYPVAITRNKMQDALIDLLRKKVYSKITISDITNLADLSRRTFYEHFGSKDDLLISLMDDVLEPIFEDLAVAAVDFFQGKEDEQVVTSFFIQWKENQEMFKLLRNTNCDLILLERFQRWCRKMHFETIEPEFNIKDELISEYTVDLVAGAFYMTVISWTDHGMVHPPELMGKFLFSILSPHNMNDTYRMYLSTFQEYS